MLPCMRAQTLARTRDHSAYQIHVDGLSATRSFDVSGPSWFDTDAIIDGTTNALFAAEITLGSLH
jgi:hypothetical protein